MLRWPVSSDLYKRSFCKSSITGPYNLTCQGISCIIQPHCENLRGNQLHLSLGFHTRSFSVFCDLHPLKVPGQKTHWFLAFVSQSQRFLLCLTAPAFISQFIHSICLIPGIFSAMVYFGFALFIFFSKGHIHHCLPISNSGVSQAVLYFCL